MEAWLCAGRVLISRGDMGVRCVCADQQWTHGCALQSCVALALNFVYSLQLLRLEASFASFLKHWHLSPVDCSCLRSHITYQSEKIACSIRNALLPLLSESPILTCCQMLPYGYCLAIAEMPRDDF